MSDAPTPPKTPAKRPRAKKAAATPADAAAAVESAAATAPPQGKRDVALAKTLYDEQKDAIKAPFKKHGLKWQYLGEGKGRYHKDGVSVFVLFADDQVHYSLSGSDRATQDAILDAWKDLLGADALAEAGKKGEQAAAEQARQPEPESEEMRLWRLQEPQRRPGEPDFFYRKRTEEWNARKPT